MRTIRSTDSLMEQIRKQISGATSKKLSVKDAQQVTKGRGYLLQNPSANTDGNNFGDWTYREIYSDQGTYINPTADSFESVIASGNIEVTTEKVTARGGNIFRRFTTVEPYWAMFSTKVFADSDRVINLTIDTKHSIWIGLDDVTVLSSTPYGPNVQTNCSFTLEEGQEVELEVGIYAGATGVVDYYIGGDIADQVSRMMPVDKEAPLPPTGVTAVTSLMDPITNRVQNKVSWDNYDVAQNYDVVTYNVFKYEDASNSLVGVTDADYELIGTVNRTEGSNTNYFVDTNIKYEDYSTYKIQSVDKDGNRSSLSTAYDQTQNVDTTGPGVVTSLAVASQFRTGIGLTWTWPSDEDLAGAIIYRDGTTDADKVTIVPYDGNSSFSRIIGGLPQGTSTTLYVRTFDKAGNQGAATASVSTNTTGFDELDTTAPGTVTDIYIDDTNAVAAGATHTLNDNQFSFLLYFIMPSDSDVAGVEIRIADNGPVVGRYAASYKLADLAAGPSEEVEFIVNFQEASQTQYIFFNTYDKSGNYLDSTGTPTWIKVTSTLVPGGGIKDVILLNPSVSPNELGWWNTTNITFTPTVEGDGTYSYGNFKYLAEGGAWGDVSGASKNWASDFAKGETDSDGETLGIKIVNDDDGDLTGPFLFTIKVDTTAPSAPTVSLSNLMNAVQVSWSEGSDALSGLWYTEIYRNTTNDSGSATLIGTVDAGTLKWIDNDAEWGTTYYYFVRHIDKASNNGTFSSSQNITVAPMDYHAHVNWLDNSSFERDAIASGVTADKWEEIGSPTYGSGSYHGTRAVNVTTANHVVQRGIPLISDYFLFSAYGASAGTPARGIQFKLEFKDLSGTVLTTLNLSCGSVSASYSRFSTTSGGDPLVVGPSGSAAPTGHYYDADATTVDVYVLSTNNDVNVDAIMMEAVKTEDSGVTWINAETDASTPSPYVDSRVLNYDRINAYIARFGTVYANNIIAGKMSSSDGSTYFDLDNDEIVLDHGAYISKMDDNGLRIIPDDGTATWRTIFHRGPAVNAWSDGISGGAKSGSFSVISSASNFQDLDGSETFTYLHPVAVYYQHTEASTNNIFKFPIEQKASSTDFGHGSWSIEFNESGTPGVWEATLNYECYIGAITTYTDRKIVVLMQNSYFYNN